MCARTRRLTKEEKNNLKNNKNIWEREVYVNAHIVTLKYKHTISLTVECGFFLRESGQFKSN
jgi:hypothetical protein